MIDFKLIIFGLKSGEVTTRDIVLGDVAARFLGSEYLVRARTSAAIDAAIASGTLTEHGGHLQTGDGIAAWMLDVEIPAGDETPDELSGNRSRR